MVSIFFFKPLFSIRKQGFDSILEAQVSSFILVITRNYQRLEKSPEFIFILCIYCLSVLSLCSVEGSRPAGWELALYNTICFCFSSFMWFCVFVSPYSAGVLGVLEGLPGWGRRGVQGSGSRTVRGWSGGPSWSSPPLAVRMKRLKIRHHNVNSGMKIPGGF